MRVDEPAVRDHLEHVGARAHPQHVRQPCTDPRFTTYFSELKTAEKLWGKLEHVGARAHPQHMHQPCTAPNFTTSFSILKPAWRSCGVRWTRPVTRGGGGGGEMD